MEPRWVQPYPSHLPIPLTLVDILEVVVSTLEFNDILLAPELSWHLSQIIPFHVLDLLGKLAGAFINLLIEVSFRYRILAGVIKPVWFFEQSKRGHASTVLHIIKIIFRAHPFAQGESDLVGQIDRPTLSLPRAIGIAFGPILISEHHLRVLSGREHVLLVWVLFAWVVERDFGARRVCVQHAQWGRLPGSLRRATLIRTG